MQRHRTQAAALYMSKNVVHCKSLPPTQQCSRRRGHAVAHATRERAQGGRSVAAVVAVPVLVVNALDVVVMVR